MNKYHDQDFIKSVAKQIRRQGEREQENILDELRECYEDATYELSRVSQFTSPEEITRREQAVYYYQDLFELLGVSL